MRPAVNRSSGSNYVCSLQGFWSQNRENSSRCWWPRWKSAARLRCYEKARPQTARNRELWPCPLPHEFDFSRGHCDFLLGSPRIVSATSVHLLCLRRLSDRLLLPVTPPALQQCLEGLSELERLQRRVRVAWISRPWATLWGLGICDS